MPCGKWSWQIKKSSGVWTNRSDKNSKKSPPDAGKIKPRQGDSHFKNTNAYDNGVGGKKEGEPAARFEFTYSPLENIEEAEKLPDKRQKKGKIAKSFRQSSQRKNGQADRTQGMKMENRLPQIFVSIPYS